MKFLAPLFAILICLSVFSGCDQAQAASPVWNERLLPREEVPLAAAPELVQPTAAAAPVDTTPPAVPARLTAEEAKAIALAHAGIPAEQIRFLRVGFDYDDRVPQYEVEFVANGWEYEYDIHAETGSILSFDKDR